MNTEDFQIKKTDINGLRQLASMAEAEGWNPGIDDYVIYYHTDPDAFYGVFKDDQMIGGGSIVSYNGDFGFMGLFIMQPEFRSSGIGTKLWYFRRDTLLSRLKKNAAIGMDGVVNMQPFYAKGGFKLAFRDERYELDGRNFETGTNISPVSEADINNIIAYDNSCFGVNRDNFIRPWLQRETAVAFKYEEGGNLRGFAVIRKASRGKRIGPLFADNANIAEELLRSCLNTAPGEKVYIDIPITDEIKASLAKKYGGLFVFECGRMYYGKPPEMALEKVFGITTLELG